MNYLSQNFTRHGSQLNKHDLLKFIAILLMLADHIGLFYFHNDTNFRLLGRFSFPIFFFLVGYSMNFRVRRDLAVMAILLALLNFAVHWPFYPVNILFSVIFCRLFLALAAREGFLTAGLPGIWLLLAILSFLTVDIFEYGTIAMLFALGGYQIRKKDAGLRIVGTYLLAILLYSYYQITGFGFTLTQSALLIVPLAALCCYFHSYRFHKFENLPKPLAYPVMFLGRNSLIIYFGHIVVLKGLWHLGLI